MNAKERIMNLVKQGVITTEEALILLENEQSDQTETGKYFDEIKKIDEEVAKVHSDIDFLSSLELIAPLNEKQEKQLVYLEEHLKELNEAKDHCEGKSYKKEAEEHGKWKEVAGEAMNQATDLVQHVGSVLKKTGSQVQNYLKEAQERQKELNTPKPFQEQYQFEGDKVTKIYIENNSGKIQIEPCETQEISIDVQAKLFTLEEDLTQFFLNKSIFKVEGEQLHIQVDDRNIVADLMIRIPEKQYKQCRINNNNGSIAIHQLHFKEAELKNTHGEILVSQGVFELLKLIVTNGKITINEVEGKVLNTDIINGPIEASCQFVQTYMEGTNSDLKMTNDSHHIEEMIFRTVNGNIDVGIKSELPLAVHAFTKYGEIDHQLNPFEVLREEDNRTGYLLEGSVRHNDALIPACLLQCESKTGKISIHD